MSATAVGIDKIRLIKPNEATGRVAEVFEDIRQTKGARYLTPTWGFFAHDPEILYHWWGLVKRLQMTPGEVPKKLLNSISLICAAEANCPRCINNHQTHLIEHFGISDDEAQDILDFENAATLTNKEKAALRFAQRVATGQEAKESEFQALRDQGYTDVAIVEIVSMAMMESGFSRHALVAAPYERGDEWPRENVPTSTYAANINR